MELWKDIPGLEGKYQASILGNVKSLDFNHTGKEKILTPQIWKKWYLRVDFYINKKQVHRRIHQIVMETFVWERREWIEINHINGVKTDNRLENLEYCTRGENISHSYKTWLRKK